jgi:HEAT repeat protein
MKKYQWVVGLSFAFIVFSFLWLLRAEIVCYLLFHRPYSNIIKNTDITDKIDSTLKTFIENNSEDFNPVLLKHLGSKDEEKADFAAVMLETNNTTPSSYYIKIYNETPFLNIKRKVIYLLPKDQKSLDFISEKLIDKKTDPETRIHCGNQLYNSNDSRIIKAAMELLDHPDPNIRTRAINCFGENRNGLYLLKIRKMIFDKDHGVRILAIFISSLHSRTLYPEYIQSLSDSNSDIACNSLCAIEDCGDKKAIPHLEKLIKTTKDNFVKQIAKEVIWNIKKNIQTRVWLR